MDGSQGGASAPAPFLTKTYEMVDDHLTDSIVSWSHGGHSFVVWNPPEFARDLLPKYFKHNNFSSFVRQLNTYGFRKIDPDQWEFANEEFIRGQRHLLKNIHRRKPIHSHSASGNSAAPLTDLERREFEDEIERLKRDKLLLQSEAERHKQENRAYENEVRSLGQRLQSIDHKQKQLVASLAQLLQKPGFVSSLIQPSETHNKKRRLMISNYFYDDADFGENQIVTFREDNPNDTSVPMLNVELIEKLDSSIKFCENFLQGISQAPGEEICDFGVLPQPPPVVITEMPASSGDCDVNVPTSSHNSQLSSPSRDFPSSPELVCSSSHADSPAPAISSLYLNLDSRPKPSGIDVNASPTNVLDVDLSKNRVEGITSASVPTGANDVFWQQFLTETPGSSDTQEVQSERREINSRKSDIKLGDNHRPWYMNNVENLTEKMGHLTPAEST